MNKEPLARAKFFTWWHLIFRLGNYAHQHLELVIVPFLEFCYGKLAQNSKNGIRGMSPAKKFNAMGSLFLEAFAQIFNCPISNPTLSVLKCKANIFQVRLRKNLPCWQFPFFPKLNLETLFFASKYIFLYFSFRSRIWSNFTP